MRFSVGDMCVIKACPCHPITAGAPVHVGMEVTILRVDPDCPNGFYYELDVIHPQGGFGWARECYLARRKPPGASIDWASWASRSSAQGVTSSEECEFGQTLRPLELSVLWTSVQRHEGRFPIPADAQCVLGVMRRVRRDRTNGRLEAGRGRGLGQASRVSRQSRAPRRAGAH
jgi:hypothetical protein